MILFTTTLAAMAQPAATGQSPNRQTSDAIFTEPKNSGMLQLLYTLGDAVAFYIVKPKLPGADSITAANERILEVAKSELPAEAKLAAIHEAEGELAKARLAAIESMQRIGAIPPWVIRYAKCVGTTLVLVDVAGRAWAWTALDANPTWSPAWQMISHVGDRISTQNALAPRNR